MYKIFLFSKGKESLDTCVDLDLWCYLPPHIYGGGDAIWSKYQWNLCFALLQPSSLMSLSYSYIKLHQQFSQQLHGCSYRTLNLFGYLLNMAIFSKFDSMIVKLVSFFEKDNDGFMWCWWMHIIFWWCWWMHIIFWKKKKMMCIHQHHMLVLDLVPC